VQLSQAADLAKAGIIPRTCHELSHHRHRDGWDGKGRYGFIGRLRVWVASPCESMMKSLCWMKWTEDSRAGWTRRKRYRGGRTAIRGRNRCGIRSGVPSRARWIAM